MGKSKNDNKQKRLVQTTKFYLIYQDRPDMTYRQFKNAIFEIQDGIRRFKNVASSQYFTYLTNEMEFCKTNGRWPTNDEAGKPAGTYWFSQDLAHRYGAELLPYLNSGCRDKLGVIMQQYFEGNHKTRRKDLIAGKASIPSYRNNQPVEYRKQEVSLFKNDNDIFIALSTFSTEGRKVLGLTSGQVIFKVDSDCKSSVTILERCLSGEYISRSGSLKYCKKKDKFEFALQYEMNQPEIVLDKNRIAGIDLGVTFPAVIAINGELEHKFIPGGDTKQFVKKIEARRRSLQECRANAFNGSTGRGRNTLMKPVDQLGHKLHNFRNTKNHIWSKSVVDWCVKHGCGTIQMEDLSGITAGKKAKFLKDWTYYDLQSKIQYKAAAVGIDVVYINPRKTSQRCSCCGYISSENRPKGDKGASYFKCQACGHEENADLNAARNISIKGIEQIIKECEPQGNMKVA